MRTREAHRNIHGNNYSELRRLFKDQHELLKVIVVDITQRVQALGQPSSSTFWDSLAVTRLTGHNERFTKQNQIIEALLDDHEFIIRTLGSGDSGAADEEVDIDTAEFTAGLLRQHIEMAESLRGWLK